MSQSKNAKSSSSPKLSEKTPAAKPPVKSPAKKNTRISSPSKPAAKNPSINIEEIKHQKNNSIPEQPIDTAKLPSKEDRNSSIKNIIQDFKIKSMKNSSSIRKLKASVESDAKSNKKPPTKPIYIKGTTPNTKNSEDLIQNLYEESKIDDEFIETIEKYFFNKFQENQAKEEKIFNLNQEPEKILTQHIESLELRITELENELNYRKNERFDHEQKFLSLEKDFEKVKVENYELIQKIYVLEQNISANAEENRSKNYFIEIEMNKLKAGLENYQGLINEFYSLFGDLAQALNAKFDFDYSKNVDLIDLKNFSFGLKNNLDYLLQEYNRLKAIEYENNGKIDFLLEENKRLETEIKDYELEMNHLFEHYQNIQEELIEKESNINEISDENYNLKMLVKELKSFAFQIESENKTYYEKIMSYETAYLKEIESRA